MPNEGPDEENRAFYASALYSQKPVMRRKHSEYASNNSDAQSSSTSQHGRSKADFTGARGDNGYSHLDPLTSNHNGFLDSTGITRPHLNRAVKKIDDDWGEDGEDPEDSAKDRKEEEREVIVHEVTSADSLAGVSLKYGITLADLRQANHLWANDSIHLRKVLYIPLDNSSRARELVQETRLSSAPLIDISTPSPTDSPELSGPSGLPPPVGMDIQRVPLSRLSFFPPPSTSGKTPSISSIPSSLSSTNPKLPRYSTTPSLTSILTALPIPASTRDDILARLSFDSVSSSFSDRSRPSLDRDEGHELDIVTKRSSNSSKRSESQGHAGDISVGRVSGSTLLIPKPGYHPSSNSMDAANAIRAPPSRGGHALHLSTSPPVAYIPQIPDRTTIRTVQLEPSPMMQLPTLRRKTQRSANGYPDDLAIRQGNAFELQDSSSRLPR